MENNTQKLAESLASILRQNESGKTHDFARLQESIEQINERLFKIENDLFLHRQPSAAQYAQAFHPSQERFEIAEAVATQQETAGQFEAEKPCPFEPTGKPCDHCSMCNSRGF